MGGHGRLHVMQPFSGVEMLAVLKRDAFKAHIARAFDDEERVHHRRDDLRLRHVLAGQWQIEHFALRLVEKPLARRVQRCAEIFHPEALIGLELDKGIARAALDLHRERFVA